MCVCKDTTYIDYTHTCTRTRARTRTPQTYTHAHTGTSSRTPSRTHKYTPLVQTQTLVWRRHTHGPRVIHTWIGGGSSHQPALSSVASSDYPHHRLDRPPSQPPHARAHVGFNNLELVAKRNTDVTRNPIRQPSTPRRVGASAIGGMSRKPRASRYPARARARDPRARMIRSRPENQARETA